MYEEIPTIIQTAVHSLYRASYLQPKTISLAGLFDSVNTNIDVADVKMILSRLALLLSIILVGVILFTKKQKNALKSLAPAQSFKQPEQVTGVVQTGVLRERWNKLLAHLDSTQESQWKVAVMEADKLVDDALAKAGYPGATFGDRLSNIQPGTLLSLDGIWWAHKIRNRLAHEVDYFLRYTEARQAVGYYEAALSELQMI